MDKDELTLKYEAYIQAQRDTNGYIYDQRLYEATMDLLDMFRPDIRAKCLILMSPQSRKLYG